MSSRNPTFRNLLGGLLGGCFGVLAAKYFNLGGMLLAGVAGVSIGWCGDLIWRRVRQVRVNVPKFSSRWPFTNTLRTAYMLRLAALFATLIINANLAIRASAEFAAVTRDSEMDLWGRSAMLWLLLAMVPCMLTLIRFDWRECSWPAWFRHPRDIYSRYIECGGPRFFIQETIHCLFISAALYLFFGIFVVYFMSFGIVIGVVLGGSLFVALSALSLLAAIGLRRGSALCLTVTLTVTTVSSIYMLPSVNSDAQVVMLALLTGGCAGCLTETLRLALVGSRKARHRMMHLASMDTGAWTRKRVDVLWNIISFPFDRTVGLRMSLC